MDQGVLLEPHRSLERAQRSVCDPMEVITLEQHLKLSSVKHRRRVLLKEDGQPFGCLLLSGVVAWLTFVIWVNLSLRLVLHRSDEKVYETDLKLYSPDDDPALAAFWIPSVVRQRRSKLGLTRCVPARPQTSLSSGPSQRTRTVYAARMPATRYAPTGMTLKAAMTTPLDVPGFFEIGAPDREGWHGLL